MAGLLAWLAVLTFASFVFCVDPVVDLKLARTFGVVVNSAITNTGATTVFGDIGTEQTFTSITGFPPGIVTGTIYDNSDGFISDVITDASDAFDAINGQTDNGADPIDITGSTLGTGSVAGYVGTLGPGAYTAVTIPLRGTFTLQGTNDPADKWFFTSDFTVITQPDTQIILAGGAQACNVWWAVGSSATIDLRSQFLGHILAQASVTFNTGAVVNRSLAAFTGSTTLDTNVIRLANCPLVVSSSSSSTPGTTSTLVPSTSPSTSLSTSPPSTSPSTSPSTLQSTSLSSNSPPSSTLPSTSQSTSLQSTSQSTSLPSTSLSTSLPSTSLPSTSLPSTSLPSTSLSTSLPSTLQSSSSLPSTSLSSTVLSSTILSSTIISSTLPSSTLLFSTSPSSTSVSSTSILSISEHLTSVPSTSVPSSAPSISLSSILITKDLNTLPSLFPSSTPSNFTTCTTTVPSTIASSTPNSESTISTIPDLGTSSAWNDVTEQPTTISHTCTAQPSRTVQPTTISHTCTTRPSIPVPPTGLSTSQLTSPSLGKYNCSQVGDGSTGNGNLAAPTHSPHSPSSGSNFPPMIGVTPTGLPDQKLRETSQDIPLPIPSSPNILANTTIPPQVSSAKTSTCNSPTNTEPAPSNAKTTSSNWPSISPPSESRENKIEGSYAAYAGPSASGARRKLGPGMRVGEIVLLISGAVIWGVFVL